MKKQFNTYFLIFSLVSAFFFESCQAPEKEDIPYVIVLSMDGFRWDYPTKFYTPALDSISKIGVKAVAMQPSYPSKTFPNHYTLATGLYPDRHGIVQNAFYDDEMQKQFRMGDREAIENGDFFLGEPIWKTAEKQGVTSAAYFWVGSEAKDKRPTYWKAYEHNFPFAQRADTVVAWLQLPEKVRPHLIMWYFSEPDQTGHEYGPDSKECSRAVETNDSLLADFIRKINKLPIAKKINLIVLSDHGMGAISEEKVVYLSKCLNSNWIDKSMGDNPVTMIKPLKGFGDSIYNTLKKTPHIKVWWKNELPARLHYGTNKRINEIIVEADSNWSITWHDKVDKYHRGTHGYDNQNLDMYAIFYAFGPAFKTNYLQPTFKNVDVYSLIAKLLEIEPAKTDGSLEEVEGMLK